MEKPKKRYIIRTYTQGSGSARNQRKRPDDHRKRPDRNNFQKSATIHIFCGRGFANRHFAETDSLYVPLSRLSRPLPEYLFTEAIGNLPTFSNIFQRFQRFERIGAGSSNALNASQKAEISDLTADFAEKSQIHNIKLRFRNI